MSAPPYGVASTRSEWVRTAATQQGVSESKHWGESGPGRRRTAGVSWTADAATGTAASGEHKRCLRWGRQVAQARLATHPGGPQQNRFAIAEADPACWAYAGRRHRPGRLGFGG